MHTHPRFWRMPYPKNLGVCEPSLIQKNNRLIIRESGYRHVLLVLLYGMSALTLSILVPLTYFATELQVIGMLVMMSMLLLVGFLHFKHSFIKTTLSQQATNQQQPTTNQLKERSLKTPIAFANITAIQIIPEINLVPNKAGKPIVDVIYHCYVLCQFSSNNNLIQHIGLFQNKDANKHREDCLQIASFCKKPIWELISNNQPIFSQTDIAQSKQVSIKQLKNQTTLNKPHS